MRQLICHHTYDTWGGMPVDRSPYGLSNGSAYGTVFSPDGAGPGSGALELHGHSAVSVPTTAAWTDLRTLDVRMLVRLDGDGAQRRVLAEGHESFRLVGDLQQGGGPGYSFSNCALTLEASDGNGGTSVLFGPAVDFDTWSTVWFSHDGVSTITLGVDDRHRSIECTTPAAPVGDRGVSFGADLSGRMPMRGALDEVLVWRWHPETVRRRTLSRPFDDATAACWTGFINRLIEIAAANGAAVADLQRIVASTLAELLRAMARAAQRDPATFAALLARYDELWRSGRLDTDEMEAAIAALRQWAEANGIGTPRGLPAVVDGINGLFGGVVGVPCDPDFTGFVQRLVRAVGGEA